MKYFDKRQNPFGSTVTDEVMESLFKELADQFGIRWLNSQGDHTLQNLWNRRDALSTNELYALAHAINRLNRIDDAWVSHQTKQIIEGDGNNQRGAFFELIGLDILMVPELYRVIPAHRNQAGIDATLAFPEGGNINLSLKNYSLSNHQNSFMKEAEAIKQNVISCLKRKQLTKAQLFIDASYRYPTSSDWKILLSELPELFDKYDGHFLSTTINDIWQLSVTDINHADQVFDTRFTSYTIVISSKYHANESQNLISKLDDATANLRKHAITDEDDLNFIFFRLPLTASAKNCIQWANEYFLSSNDTLISGVIFYQPAIVTEFSGKTYISHYLKPVLSTRFYKWIQEHPKNKLGFFCPVGVPITEPSAMIITNGKEKVVTVDERYIAQFGEHYTSAKVTSTGFEGDIKHLGPGIQQYTVLQLTSNDRPLVIGGHFGDQLLVF